MKRINLIALFLILSHVAFNQGTLDILTLSGRLTSPSNYESTLNGTAQETGSFLGLTVPIPLSEKTIIYNSLNYFYFNVDQEPQFDASIMNPINLHGFILRTGLIQRLDNGQSIQALLAPRFMTDMQGSNKRNFQMGALLMYEKVFSDHLTMGFGSMYNQECFGPYLVPIVNLNWQISNKFSISGLLPIYAKIKYQHNEKLALGISHFGLSTTYRLNNPTYQDDYMERMSIDLSLFANYHLFNNFYAEARIGRTMARSYKQYASDQKVAFAIPLATFGDNRTIKNELFEDGLFSELRLIYRIQIPE